MIESDLIVIVQSQFGIDRISIKNNLTLKKFLQKIANLHQVSAKSLRQCNLLGSDLMNKEIDIQTPIANIPGFKDGANFRVDFDFSDDKVIEVQEQPTQLQKLKRLTDLITGEELNPKYHRYQFSKEQLPTSCGHNQRTRCQFCLTHGTPSQHCGHGPNAKCIKCTKGIVPSIYCQHHHSIICLNCIDQKSKYTRPPPSYDSFYYKKVKLNDNQKGYARMKSQEQNQYNQNDKSIWISLLDMISCSRKKQREE